MVTHILLSCHEIINIQTDFKAFIYGIIWQKDGPFSYTKLGVCKFFIEWFPSNNQTELWPLVVLLWNILNSVLLFLMYKWYWQDSCWIPLTVLLQVFFRINLTQVLCINFIHPDLISAWEPVSWWPCLL